MTMIRRSAPALLLAAISAFDRGASAADWTAQDLAAAAALRDRALAGTSAYEHVTSLTTEVGPRFAGSSGDAAAVRWALNKLGNLGFSRVRTQDVLVPRWVRGTAEVSIVGPAPKRWSRQRSAAASARPKKESRRQSLRSPRSTL